MWLYGIICERSGSGEIGENVGYGYLGKIIFES